METCFKHGNTFNTFARVLQNVFKSYMNERVSGDMFEFLFVCYKRRKYGSLYALRFSPTSAIRENNLRSYETNDSTYNTFRL
jgi:hypothetical protein